MSLRTVLSMLMLIGASGCVLSAPGHSGPSSDHFDGTKFRNEVVRDTGFKRFLQWALNRSPGPWSEKTDNKTYPKPAIRVDGNRAVFTFVNHATFLIQVDGLNILTDPIWSERASPFSFIGPKRARPPGIAFDDLPPIDIVVISHNHYDHLNIETLKRLDERDHPLFIAGLGNKLLLDKIGIKNAIDLDWWHERRISDRVTVVGVPAQHFSGRGLFDRDRTLWMGHVIKTSVGNFFFAGDTGFGPHFQTIAQALSPIRVALIPIGAFMPEWFMGPVHLSPQGAVDAARALGAQKSFGIHFGTFQLADDGQSEPLEKLKEALAKLESPLDFTTLDFGESWELKP